MNLLAAFAVAAALLAPAPPAARNVAKTHVVKTFHVSGFRDIFSVRSRRAPSWVLVVGFYTRPKPAHPPGMWAVWLRFRNGRWIVRYAGLNRRAIDPPVRIGAPCDIQPAFSEPSC
jgi:hypothetical protein